MCEIMAGAHSCLQMDGAARHGLFWSLITLRRGRPLAPRGPITSGFVVAPTMLCTLEPASVPCTLQARSRLGGAEHSCEQQSDPSLGCMGIARNTVRSRLREWIRVTSLASPGVARRSSPRSIWKGSRRSRRARTAAKAPAERKVRAGLHCEWQRQATAHGGRSLADPCGCIPIRYPRASRHCAWRNRARHFQDVASGSRATRSTPNQQWARRAAASEHGGKSVVRPLTCARGSVAQPLSFCRSSSEISKSA